MSEIKPLRDSYGRAARFFTGDGANGTWTFTIRDSSGAAVSLTGMTIKVIMREDIDSTTNILSGVLSGVNLTQSGATLGQFTVDFSAENVTTQYTRAVLIAYNVVSSKNRVLAVYALDVCKGIAV